MNSAILALAAFGTAISGIASPAAAGTISVEYADLNLNTEAGQKALEFRIDRAAREVCEVGQVRTGTRIVSADVRACYREAKAKADKQFAALIDGQRLGG